MIINRAGGSDRASVACQGSYGGGDKTSMLAKGVVVEAVRKGDKNEARVSVE